MKTVRDQVIEFHKAVGQPILETPQIPSAERVRLRARLIAEEFFETLSAMFTRDALRLNTLHENVQELIDTATIRVDLPELADGLADLDYVVEGTRLEFGINGEPIAAEVHASNLFKTSGPVRADGKIGKPSGWCPPDIDWCLRVQGWNGK